jgi:RluA family pseudouridine synthase
LPADIAGIRIVFEDEDIIVVDKPAGLLTIATEAEREKTLYAWLRKRANQKKPAQRIFIVHRLDREASGLVVFAKSIQAKQGLQEQFKSHSAGRRYCAVVEGRVEESDFSIRSYLSENAAYRMYSTRKKGVGKVSVTHVHVVRRNRRSTILQVRLETGRKHQIRVHLAEKGHPIVGDKIYSSGWNPIRRLALHGEHLGFTHPGTGKRLEFESKYPKSFDAIL